MGADNPSMALPPDIRAEHNTLDGLRRDYPRRGLGYAVAVLRQAPGAAIKGLLTLVLMATLLTVDQATLQWATGEGIVAVARAMLVWFGIFVLSLWLAGRVWLLLGATLREYLRTLVTSGFSLVKLGLAYTAASALFSIVVYWVNAPEQVNRHQGSHWRIPVDESGLYPLRVTASTALRFCRAGERLASAADAQRVWPDLKERQHHLVFWTSNRDGERAQIFKTMGENFELAWIDHARQREVPRFQVLCVDQAA